VKPGVQSLFAKVYRHLLRLYPAAFRAEFGDEMQAVFATAVREAAEEGPGAVGGLAQWLYLRRVVDHAGYWVLASMIAYSLFPLGAFPEFTGWVMELYGLEGA
jgi:hypothetical protein